MKDTQNIDITQESLSLTQKLNEAQFRWLEKHSKDWNIAACWHIPNSMRTYYKGYDADWLAKELTRYFNRVDRRICKAAYKNRGIRLQRIVTLEYDENVGWHAHGLLECALGMNEDETIAILDKLWREKTVRFATEKFEKHLSYFGYDNGRYLQYCLKRLNRHDDKALGILDTRNTYFSNN